MDTEERARTADDEMKKIAAALPHYEEGMKFFKTGNVKEAKKNFELFSAVYPDDKVSAIYISRCNDMIENGNTNDPDGVTRLNIK